MNGARGKTETQIKRAMGFTNTDENMKKRDDIAKEFGELIKQYSKETPDLCILAANLMAVSKDIEIKPQFRSIGRQYNAKVTTENFQKAAKVQKKINIWVANQTLNMIPEMMKNPPPQEMAMIIISAIYFMGKWNETFNANQTKPKSFKNSDGSTSEVPMISKRGPSLLYLEKGSFESTPLKKKILEIPYKYLGSMYILLPKSGEKPQKILDEIDPKILLDDLKALREEKLDLISIPKFKIEQEYDLKKVLGKMGMKDAFTAHKADFTGISSTPTYVSQSTHKAVVEIDEEGSHAAAATEILVISKSARARKSFIANRPFIFLIRDRTNSITLFAGIINKL
ncbi:leukocyte elastase inhibitor-like [Brevipalpus obovatus]|uniref:leukocyte elastase inhibitor-like n=1 Tax=Brevipalpus obovatus TaxID=246614 RepID=UPI003D9F57CB